MPKNTCCAANAATATAAGGASLAEPASDAKTALSLSRNDAATSVPVPVSLDENHGLGGEYHLVGGQRVLVARSTPVQDSNPNEGA